MANAIESDQSLVSLVNRKVQITSTSKKKSVKCGYVVCVDPESNAILLYDDSEDRLYLLLEHAIKSVVELPDEEQHGSPMDLKHLCDQFFEVEDCTRVAQLSEEDCEARRRRVMQVLASHNVPVEEVDNTLVAAYCVSITAPYTPDQCKSFNPIVLGRIKHFMQQDML